MLIALLVSLASSSAFAGVIADSITILSGNNQSAPTGTVLPDPLTVQYNNSAGSPIPGGSLIFNVTGGDAVFDASNSTQQIVSADGAGQASLFVRFGSTPGPVTVEVTDFGTTPAAVFNLTATAPVNSITVISGDGQQANINDPFANPLVVELRDGVGMLPDGVPVTFQISSGVATFSNGQLSMTSNTAGGRAQASLVAGDQQGNVNIVIRAAGYSDAFASALVNRPGGNPSVFIVSGQSQQTAANTPFAMPLVARVDDGVIRAPTGKSAPAVRAPVPNVPVTFTVRTGNALFSNGQGSIVVLSDTSGDAAVFVDATSPEGQVLIDVTTDSFGSTVADLEIIGGSGAILQQQGGFQTIAPGDSTPTPLIAQVQSSSATPVPGITVTFRVRDTGFTPPTGISFTPSSDVSDSTGNVTFVVNTTADTPNGSFDIEASAPGYTPAVFRLSVSDKAGSISFDKLRGDNQSGNVVQPLPVPFEVQALNSGYSVVPIGNLVVTYTVTGGSASIVDANGNPQQTVQVLTNANGIASASVIPEDPAGPFQVTATANISGTDFSEVFNGTGIAVASPTVTIVSGDGQSGQPNTNLPQPIVAEFRDGSGNPIVGGVVHFRINSGDALLQPVGGSTPSTVVQVTTDSLGQAAVEMVLGATAGSIVAEAGGDPDFVINAPFGATIAAGAPTLTILSGDGQSGPPLTTAPLPIIAEYRNSVGNPIAGARLVVQITAGDAQVSSGTNPPSTSITVFTDDSGRISSNLLFGATAGAVTGRVYPFVAPVRPGEPPEPGEVPFTATITGGATLTITNGDNQTGEPNAALPVPLTVRLLDGSALPISGAPVTYTVSSGTASFASSATFSTVTDSAGDAFATLDLGATPGPVTVTATSMGQTVTFNETIALPPDVPPTITYNPAPGSQFTLNADGSTAFGSINATPSGGSGTGPAATTTIDNCSFATNPVSFAVSGQPLAFEGSTTQPGSLSLTCQVGPSAATARLTCSETSGTASAVARTFDVTCPAAPPAPTIALVSGDGQSGPPNTQLPQPVVVEYRDGNGTPVASHALFFSITSANAMVRRVGDTTFSPNAFGSTDVSGQASFEILLGSSAGPVTGTVCEAPRGPDAIDGFAQCAPFTATIAAVPPVLTITGGNNQTGPPNATLPDPLTVRLLDGSGAPINGATVTYTVTSGTASFSGQTSFSTGTDSSGNASATLNLGGTPGPVTVTASTLGQTVTFNETIAVPNAAPMVTFNPPAGSGFTLSASGPSASGSITATPSGGSGSGPAATTTIDNCTFATNPVSFAVSGQPLTFVGPDTTPQSLSLTCQVAPSSATARLTCSETIGVAAPVTKFFDVTCPAAPAAPTITIISGNGQSGPPDTQLTQPAVAEFRDGNGNPVAGRFLQFSITSANALVRLAGNATFASTAFGSTNAAGQASFEVQLGSSPGQVTGTVCEAPNGPNAINGFAQCAPFTATIVAPAPGSMQIVSGNNQSGAPGAASQPLRVRLVPPQGVVGFGVPVTFTVVSGSGALLDANGNPSAQVVVGTDADGTASVVFRFGNVPGPVRIQAAADRFGSVVFDLTVLGAGTSDVFRIVSGNGQSGAPGTRSQGLVVELLRNGAPRAGQTINWFIRTGDAQVENFATTTGSDGRSTNFITFGQSLGPIVVEARTGDGLQSVQFTLTTTPASALVVRLVSGGGQSGIINSPFAAPLVFEVANSQGQVQPGVLVGFAVTQGSATLGANSATTDSAGRVSVTGRYGPNAGAIQVRATIGTAPNQSSALADLTAIAPGLRIVSGNNQSALVSTALAAPLVVELTQPATAGGSLAGIQIRWTVIEGGGVVATATATTDAAGRASNTLTLGPQPGTNRVRVDTDGGGTVTFVATATTAVPPTSSVRLEIVSGNNQNIATNSDSAPLVVRVLDSATGAPRSNVCVAFTAVTPGVTLSLAQVGSDVNGLARVTARLADVGPAVVSASICNSAVGQVNFAINGAIGNTLGLDPDDRAFGIAQALDGACPALRALRSSGTTLSAGQADLLARCDDLEFNAGSDPDGTIDALEEILSDEAEAQNTAALTIAAAQFDNLKARIAALRSGTNGASFGGLALQGGNGAVPLSFASSALNATEGQPVPTEAGIDFDRWGFFATGTIGEGDRDPGGGSSGFDFETRGLTAGVDYRYSDALIFGAALGYASNDVDIGGAAGELETTGWSISGYTTFYKGDSWYADGVLTYGSNQYDITRNVAFTLATPTGTVTTVDQVNTASPDGTQFSAAFTAGRDFQRGAWGFGPFLRWQYTKVDFDSYSESASNPGAPGQGLVIAVDEREVKSMQGVFGGKATYTLSTAWGILIPHFQFEYVREFKDDPDALVSRLVFDPTGTAIAVEGADVDQSFMNLGLGASAVFANGRSAFIYYEKLLGQEGTSKDSIAIGIRIEF